MWSLPLNIFIYVGCVNYGFPSINTHGDVQPTKHSILFEKAGRTKQTEKSMFNRDYTTRKLEIRDPYFRNWEFWAPPVSTVRNRAISLTLYSKPIPDVPGVLVTGTTPPATQRAQTQAIYRTYRSTHGPENNGANEYKRMQPTVGLSNFSTAIKCEPK